MSTRRGKKKWFIDFQSSRNAPRIRRTIIGPRALAEEVLLEFPRRALGESVGWPQPSTTTIRDLCNLVVTDYRLNKRKSVHSAKQIRRVGVEQFGGREAEAITGRFLKDLAIGWIQEGLSPGELIEESPI
jgi:hypothetical protein